LDELDPLIRSFDEFDELDPLEGDAERDWLPCDPLA